MDLQRISQRRINLVAGAILIGVALLVGAIAFYVMQRQVQSLLRNSLQTSLHSRVQWIQSEIRTGSDRLATVAHRPFMNRQLQRAGVPDTRTDALQSLNQFVIPAILQSGVSGIAIFDSQGRELVRGGRMAGRPELSVPLKLPGQPRLLWQGGFLLERRDDVLHQGRVIGQVLVQSRMPAISDAFVSASPLGRTGEQALCASSGNDMLCFPMALTPRATTYPKRSAAGVPLPMTHALEGRSGFIGARDYRQQKVVAAFSPVGDLGLGMVLKMDSDELYAPVWNQGGSLLPLVAAALLAALLLLRWQLSPLVAGLARSERQARDAFELLKATEAKLRHLAHYDALTDLPNRGLVRDRIQQAIASARRSATPFAVMFLDLDKFKDVNDSFGHDVGDQLLQRVAARLTESLRAQDTVGRQGGDEFIVLLAGLGAAGDAGVVARKLLDCLDAPFLVGGQELRSSVSIGIAVYPQDGDDVDGLLKHADSAMYHAKDAGRSNYQFYASALNEAAAERSQLEADLRQAIARDEMQLHYQPLVAMADGAIVATEALVRWHHPRLGVIEPSRFIPIAESSGLIVPLGEWVLRRACEQLQQWRQQGIGLQRMVVNLSPRQFREKHLLESFVRILGETGVDPHWLGLEITESVIMETPEVSIEVLRGLKALGIEISLDDFGTGYSSLSYLKRFPIDKLKIDQSFVRDLGSDDDDAAMVAAIIVMAHQLHIRVVAEGVETAGQLAFLRDRGCDEYQGFLFSRPLAPDQLEPRLQALCGGAEAAL